MAVRVFSPGASQASRPSSSVLVAGVATVRFPGKGVCGLAGGPGEPDLVEVC